MPDTGKYKNFEDVKCLWMKYGATDYRICDNCFECDACDFNKQILSKLRLRGDIQERIDNLFELGQHDVSFSHPHYHFNGGQMVRNFLSDNYYMGLEPFIGKFIDSHSTIRYCTNNDFVKKGDPVLHINNGWGEVTVYAPFSFRFIEKMDINNIFSKDRHWFAIIEAERSEVLGNSINKKGYFDKLFETKVHLTNLIRKSENIGTTMYDGGEVLGNWSDVLGKSTYRDLLEKLFS